MEAKENVRLVEFECVEEPDTQYEAGAPTNGQRSRQIMPNISHRQSQFQSFDCDAVDLAPGTKAEPRPLGRERRELEGTDLATTNEERDLLPPLKSVLDETQQIGESTQQIKAQPKLELEENPNSRTAEMLDLLRLINEGNPNMDHFDEGIPDTDHSDEGDSNVDLGK